MIGIVKDLFISLFDIEPDIVQLMGYFPEDSPPKHVIYKLSVLPDEDSEEEIMMRFIVVDLHDDRIIARVANEEEVGFIQKQQPAETETEIETL